MTDIKWHTDMENCPNDVPIIIKHNDGTFRFEAAEENDTDWNRYYPMEISTIRGVSTPIAYAVVST